MKFNQYPKFINCLLVVSLCVVWSGCEKGGKVQEKVSRNGELANRQISEKSEVIDQAKLFLHLLLGREAYEYYNNPKRSPEAIFFPEKKTWNVFFNHPAGGLNIELSSDASKANYRFRNGSVIRENEGDLINSNSIPLFTLVEMMELFSRPHNIWRD